jgi:hypothetical protein
MTKLASSDVAGLDLYKFIAVIGKQVIHPGGRASTETGPSEMMTPRGFLADEGLAGCLAIMARVAARPAHMRKMAWLMPRMARAVPYLGYIVVAGTKPR